VITNRGAELSAFSKRFSLLDGIVIPMPATHWEPERVLISDARQVPYASAHRDRWTGDDVKALSFVDELIQMGVASNPKSIGAPFSVLVLRVSGAKWLRQNNCADIHTQERQPAPQRLHKK
jgi:hypothetical protein